MIASVAFRNFKALRATSLVLAPFNLVIGSNGSGKTSLIQALLRLRSLSRLPLAASPPPASRAGGPEVGFRFVPRYAGLEVHLGCVTDLVCDFLSVSPADAPGWPALRTDIAGIRSYLLDHHAMAEPAPKAHGAVLASDGANLSAVLFRLRAEAPAAFASFCDEALRLFPECTAVEFVEPNDDTVALALLLREGALVSAENLSEGTLYLLAFLALAFASAPPTVLCIEEIDRGIHPRLLREVRDALYRLCYPASFGGTGRPVQIIATTHSPYLLDLFKEHPEEIVLAQKHAGVAHFERLADRADLAGLLAEGSLGDMWYSGILGGVPDEP